jgi:hypothetical protein
VQLVAAAWPAGRHCFSNSQTLSFHLNSVHIAICALGWVFLMFASAALAHWHARAIKLQTVRKQHTPTVCSGIAQHYSQFALKHFPLKRYIIGCPGLSKTYGVTRAVLNNIDIYIYIYIKRRKVLKSALCNDQFQVECSLFIPLKCVPFKLLAK